LPARHIGGSPIRNTDFSMRAPSYSGRFRRDVRLAQKRGKNLAKLRRVMELLIDNAPLEPALRDHALQGVWRDWRDLHIEPDWILIYRADGLSVRFERTGSHADLFD
jgi:mRNA interferase YafQ